MHLLVLNQPLVGNSLYIVHLQLIVLTNILTTDFKRTLNKEISCDITYRYSKQESFLAICSSFSMRQIRCKKRLTICGMSLTFFLPCNRQKTAVFSVDFKCVRPNKVGARFQMNFYKNRPNKGQFSRFKFPIFSPLKTIQAFELLPRLTLIWIKIQSSLGLKKRSS